MQKNNPTMATSNANPPRTPPTIAPISCLDEEAFEIPEPVSDDKDAEELEVPVGNEANDEANDGADGGNIA